MSNQTKLCTNEAIDQQQQLCERSGRETNTDNLLLSDSACRPKSTFVEQILRQCSLKTARSSPRSIYSKNHHRPHYFQSCIKAAFHDTKTDNRHRYPREEIARVVDILCFQDGGNQKQKWSKTGRLTLLARVGRKYIGVSGESLSVSMSVSWYAAFNQ